MQCGFQWSGSFAECSTPPHWGVEGMGLRVGGMGCHLSQRLRVGGGRGAVRSGNGEWTSVAQAEGLCLKYCHVQENWDEASVWRDKRKRLKWKLLMMGNYWSHLSQAVRDKGKAQKSWMQQCQAKQAEAWGTRGKQAAQEGTAITWVTW